jgi:BlaI family transcriptional regulator, penicillinase repressor
MGNSFLSTLSRRERQIVEAIYELGEATVADVVRRVGEPEAHDSVRVTLANLERKGVLKRRAEGNRNIYRAAVSREKATRSAVKDLLNTFFAGSSSRAILAMLDLSRESLTKEELDEIAERLDQAEDSAR